MRERGPVVTAKLTILVAAMRAGGARVGIGDLLTAHRALAAVDASSPADSYLALRAALCSKHADLEVFDAAFDATFGAVPQTTKPAPVELPEAARIVVPRVAVPPAVAPRAAGSADDAEVVPAAWSEVELLREK